MYSLNEDLIPPKGLLLGTSREYVHMGIIFKGLEGPTSFNCPQQCSQELKGDEEGEGEKGRGRGRRKYP